MPPLPRVLADTNVLFPFSVMDLLLALTEDGVHTILWTEALLDEWERVIVRSGRRSASSAAAVTTAVRTFFPDAEVRFDDYADLIARMPGRDPDDRVHMAAAAAGHATHLVTRNLSDFPAAPLAAYGVMVADPDTYLCELCTEFENEVTSTVVRLAGEKRHPPMSTADLLGYLERAGVERFAARVRSTLSRIPIPDPENDSPSE
ncbi:PIN domain-containing protein [Frankia sp. Cj3]|uniref:PIN domain-containing protein n=1 Tax=Frankia sp. Cj3 TaxID=2880976 RepID=UPI001EF743C6|nr:PIN domain-containing protein [Frankia sp. Cj3]